MFSSSFLHHLSYNQGQFLQDSHTETVSTGFRSVEWKTETKTKQSLIIQLYTLGLLILKTLNKS